MKSRLLSDSLRYIVFLCALLLGSGFLIAQTVDVPADTEVPSNEPPDDSGTALAPPVEVQKMLILYDFGFELVANQPALPALVPGDLLTSGSIDTGGASEGQSVLLMVKEVRDGKVFLLNRWADRSLQEGDELVALKRLGVQLDAFSGAVIVIPASESIAPDFFVETGVRAAWTWGLVGFRPALFFAVPLGPAIGSLVGTVSSDTSPWLPFEFGGGFEYSFYLGHVRLQPQFNTSVFFLLPLGVGLFSVPGFRVEAILRAAFALDPRTELFVEAGYQRNFGDSFVSAAIGGSLRFSLGISGD